MRKTLILVPVLAGLVAGGATATAAEPKPAIVDPDQQVVITGSHIKKSVRRIGTHTTDGIAPVYVIGRQEIERSGGQTVGQVLRRVPFVTVKGF